MINSVTVIGLGTIGGFLSKHISTLENIKELVIIDFDIVERSNVRNSIYTYSQLGEFKVDALSERLNDDVTVTKIREKYIEGITVLPKTDLVIDCRDVVCDRDNEIDVRFYISDNILIIDCRKKVETNHTYPGRYNTKLSKSEINKAAFFAAQIINTKQLNEMIQRSSIQKIDLDLIPCLLNNTMKRNLENRVDIIYDASDGLRQLQGIDESIKPILELNQKQDVHVYFGSQKITEQPKVITKHSIKQPHDIMLFLSKLIKETGSSSNFIVLVNENNVVELVEETGAA